MVYCPYVFLLTKSIPPLHLQPTEIASAHWVPIRSLLHEKYQNYWIQDVSNQSSRQGSGMRRAFHHFILGDMIFVAIRLNPSESKYTTETAEYISSGSVKKNRSSDGSIPLLFTRKQKYDAEDREASLLLWGLTLSVVGDFVNMLPPYDTVTAWAFPSFTAPDLRFFLWVFSYNHRRKAVKESGASEHKMKLPEPKPGNMLITFKGEERYYGRILSSTYLRRDKRRFALMPGYFKFIVMAGWATATFRLSCIVILSILLTRKIQT
jgi:hypothetical protein